jgi:hypothetical protein
MILRAMGLGFLLWLAETLGLRFGGLYFFTPEMAPSMIAFGVNVAISALVTFLLLKLLREAHGDEAEAAICIAFPGLLFNAFILYQFSRVYPALDPALDAVFGAHMLISAAAIVFTGLFFTRLAPADERL